MSNKVPQIRFNGYSDDWEERKLGDIFVYKQGQQVPVENQFTKLGKNRHRFIRIVDLTTKNEAPRYIEYSGDNIISSTDLFMIRYGQPGVIGYGYEGVIANNLFKLIPKIETYNLFFKYILDSMYPKIQSLSSSTTMPAISFKSLDVLAVKYPDKKEQEKIGSFFAQLDNTIALHQRKLDLLKEQKKGYLQKMFPKNGEKIPELRFAGFADDWEERKLNEVAIFYNGQRIPIDSSLRKQGEYPYYGATGIIDYVEDYIFDGEFVLLAEDGANITMRNSPIAYLTQGKFWLNNHAHIMAMRDGSNNFLVQLLEKQNYEKYNSGTAQPKLNSQVVKSLNFLFPTKEEQQKIGVFFKQLDSTITLHQRKLELLKEQKKGFLQKMFV